jgi:hypothetical protein
MCSCESSASKMAKKLSSWAIKSLSREFLFRGVYVKLVYIYKNLKLSLYQAVEVSRDVRRRGFHIV